MIAVFRKCNLNPCHISLWMRDEKLYVKMNKRISNKQVWNLRIYAQSNWIGLDWIELLSLHNCILYIELISFISYTLYHAHTYITFIETISFLFSLALQWNIIKSFSHLSFWWVSSFNLYFFCCLNLPSIYIYVCLVTGFWDK